MKKNFKIASIIFLFALASCSKDALTNISKLTNSQTQARLREFPNLLGLNENTEGSFQLFSQSNAAGVSRNLPSRESLLGVINPALNTPHGIDMGKFCVNGSCSKTVKYPIDNDYGVYYEGDNIGTNDVFGKTVSYNLQKEGNRTVFEGEMYIPERIKFSRPNPTGIAYWSREAGNVTWTPDPNNNIGVGVYVVFENPKTGKTRGETFLTNDDGELNAKDFLVEGDSIYTQVGLTLYRGNGIVEKGSDNRKYRILVYSSCFCDLFLTP